MVFRVLFSFCCVVIVLIRVMFMFVGVLRLVLIILLLVSFMCSDVVLCGVLM